ncbi:MAG: aminotransferase class I/II-fold pyridoxal phosphate-dependent enzyme [Deltaproteobacteria bacterium]|nr:aminotransferase class I/II-fold pyridoxal phosphate-dependent enzyme [Deltaproteobacteria bacterium]
MRPTPFALERYFARYEFSAKHLLSSSDCEALSLAELLSLADGEGLSSWQNLRLGYTESQGMPVLREQIALMHQGLSADDVLEVVPQEGVFLAMNALLERGDHVIAPFPGYQSLYAVAEAIGCEVTRWCPEEQQGWRFDPGFVRDSLRPGTRLIVCNFPHNPTGYLPCREEFDELVQIARQAGVHLFSDEMYRFAEHDESARLPSAAEAYERGVALGGLSKAFGLPGLRVGWLLTRDSALRERILRLKDYTTICASAPSEVLASIALRARDRILERNVGLLRRNLQTLDGFLQAHSHAFEWLRPRAGSVGFARVHAGQGAARFCESLVRETGVMLLPSTVYDWGDRHVRFGFGRADLPAAIAKLEGWMARGGDGAEGRGYP